jgi:hypothetical protein
MIPHQLLWRNPVRREEVRDSCRLIIRRRKDAGPYSPVFGFADQQAGDQEREGFKDLKAHQRTKVFKPLDNF